MLRLPCHKPYIWAVDRLGAWALAVALLGNGCTDPKPRGEVVPDPANTETVAQIHEVLASRPQLPTAPEVPAGIAPELWSDLHWLPANVIGINGTGPGKPPLIADWAFSQPDANNEACHALQRGLARGYGIEWEQLPQSFVFYGTADFADIEACAKVFMEGALGGDGPHDRPGPGASRRRTGDPGGVRPPRRAAGRHRG